MRKSVLGAALGNWTYGHERYELTADDVALKKAGSSLICEDFERFRSMERSLRARTRHRFTFGAMWESAACGLAFE